MAGARAWVRCCTKRAFNSFMIDLFGNTMHFIADAFEIWSLIGVGHLEYLVIYETIGTLSRQQVTTQVHNIKNTRSHRQCQTIEVKI